MHQWNKFAYTSLTNMLCQNKKCQDMERNNPSMTGYINTAFAKIQDTIDNDIWYGIDVDTIGKYCSIAVVVFITIQGMYSAASWIVRLLLFKNNNIGLVPLLCRTTFPNFFLIAKVQKTQEGNNVP